MLKINLDALTEAHKQLEKFHHTLADTYITRAAGDWSPRIQAAVDIYLTKINTEIQQDFCETALQQYQQLGDYIENIQFQDHLPHYEDQPVTT